MKPKLNMTVKAWKRFGDEYKIQMQKKFDIILVDHQTKSEKAFTLLKKFNMKNFNLGVNKFNKGLDEFHHMMDQLSLDGGQKYKKRKSVF